MPILDRKYGKTKQLAFESDYAKVACKFEIISTLISPVRLVKYQATNIVISKDKSIIFTKATKNQPVGHDCEVYFFFLAYLQFIKKCMLIVILCQLSW